MLERVSRTAAGDLQSGFVRLLEIDGVPYQIVDPFLDTPLQLVDLRDEPDPERAAEEWMRAEYSRPVDVVADRLIVSRRAASRRTRATTGMPGRTTSCSTASVP